MEASVSWQVEDIQSNILFLLSPKTLLLTPTSYVFDQEETLSHSYFPIGD